VEVSGPARGRRHRDGPATGEPRVRIRNSPRRNIGDAGLEDAERHQQQHGAADGLHDRRPTGHSAPPPAWNGSNDSATEATLNTTKPRLYILARPNTSPRRPNVTTSTACTSR
jgi:hypothetical protein